MPAQAATFIVNSTADPGDGTCDVANCTLREAMTAANAAAGDDSITFSVSGTITLGATLPGVNVAGAALTIDGSGQAVIVSGNNSVRPFLATSGAVLNLTALSVANGSTAGGGGGLLIGSGAVVTITRCTFSNNVASDDGGAIDSQGGGLSIFDSTFTGNQADVGGAIRHISGSLLVVNSTFSGNRADIGGNQTVGAIVATSGGSQSIINSTFTGNTATNSPGAILVGTGKSLTLSNTLLAGNSPDNCQNLGNLTDGGGNLDDGTSYGFTAPTSMSLACSASAPSIPSR